MPKYSRKSRSRHPRNQRWERRPEARPDEILDAALPVFAAHGYRATRLDEVARRAGVTKGTIYHYFKGKDDLLLEAVKRRRDLAFAEVEAAMGPSEDPVSLRLERLHAATWARWRQPQSRQILRLMLNDVSAESPRVFREWLREGFLVKLRLVTGLIEEGKARGEFRPDLDGEVAARVFLSGMLLQMLLHYEMGLGDVAPIDTTRLGGAAFDIWLFGLMGRGDNDE